jgi:hypothetical protein
MKNPPLQQQIENNLQDRLERQETGHATLLSAIKKRALYKTDQ